MERTSTVLKLFVSAAVAVVAGIGCSELSFVEGVTIANPTDYTANVSVKGGADDGWLLLTTIHGGAERTVERVIDQGPRWIFRFSYSGHAEEVEVSRADLESAGWRVEVPASFESALRARGVTPPP